ncbi:MAG: hypothetical protein ACFFA5_00545 [Promethearchaeota archaeon]
MSRWGMDDSGSHSTCWMVVHSLAMLKKQVGNESKEVNDKKVELL